jgi:hypothetical protein
MSVQHTLELSDHIFNVRHASMYRLDRLPDYQQPATEQSDENLPYCTRMSIGN